MEQEENLLYVAGTRVKKVWGVVEPDEGSVDRRGKERKMTKLVRECVEMGTGARKGVSCETDYDASAGATEHKWCQC
jgi:hypothetical protein